MILPVPRVRARNHLHPPSGRELDHRNLPRRNVPILRGLHFFLRRQIQPQLKAAHASLGLLRHLRVNDAPGGRHPLHVSGAQVAAVAEMILVPHVPVQHVRDGLESAMRMSRKAGEIIVRIVRVKLIEHQERIDVQPALASEAAAQLHAGAVGGGDRLDDTDQISITHGVLRIPLLSGFRLHRFQAASRAISAAAFARPDSLLSGLIARPSA